MALNPSIIAGIRSPKFTQPDAVGDYTEGIKLKTLLGQQQDQDLARSDDRATRAAYQSSGGDMSAVLKSLEQGGQYKAAQALKDKMLGVRKAEADITHTGAQTAQANATAGKTAQETKFAAADRHAREVANIQTPQEIPGYIDAGIAAGVFPAQAREQMLQKAASFPTVEAWKQAQIQAAIPVVERFKVEAENSRNAATNKTSRDNNTATVGVQYAKLAEDKRHHGAVEGQAGKAPAGYAWGPKGEDGTPTMIAVKGGPADQKMAGALNQDTQALTGSMSSFDRLATAANEVLNHPGLKGISGLRGAIPNIPGTSAADAQALLGTLKSQVGFGVLQDMRNNSKTGGALGSVSDAEGKRLEANLAALDKSQSIEQFQSNLKKIIEYSEGAKGRLRDAYNLKHGEGSVNPVRSGGATGSFAPTPAKTKAGASVSNW